MTDAKRAARVWWQGLRIGLASIAREPILGLKRLVLPASYWRTAEFAYVLEQLGALPRGARVLDLGSPKELASILSRYRGFHVFATDILPQAVLLSERYARAQGMSGDGPGKIRSEVQDGRQLAYPDNYFDAAVSVSVIEHIPDTGDTQAMRELVRVVRPGGRVVVTTPFDATYRETFVEGDVYERKAEGHTPIFFERHYDEPALNGRLIQVAEARCIDRQLWGEGYLRLESVLRRLGRFRSLLSPIEAALAVVGLRRVERAPGTRAMAAFFVVEKLRSDAAPWG